MEGGHQRDLHTWVELWWLTLLTGLRSSISRLGRRGTIQVVSPATAQSFRLWVSPSGCSGVPGFSPGADALIEIDAKPLAAMLREQRAVPGALRVLGDSALVRAVLGHVAQEKASVGLLAHRAGRPEKRNVAKRRRRNTERGG